MNIEYTRRLEKIEKVLIDRLPATADTTWLSDSFSALPQAVRGAHISNLTEPCRDLMLRGGKRWRPLLMVLACELSGGRDRAYPLVPVVEFAHTASLVHDDIEDCAEERRGKPSVHILYGEDVAINCGAWLYFQALSVIDSFPSADSLKLVLYKTVARELRRLHLGQAMDISWHRDSSMVPVRAEYEAMVSMKTGTLARLAGELGMLVGGKSEGESGDFGELSARIGVGFQVIDDVRNLTTGNPGKKRGDDIVEGKKSLPVILHLEKHPDDLAVLSESFARARSEGISSPSVEHVISMLEDSDSIGAACEYGKRLIDQSCCTLRGRYPGKPETELIAGLFESMLEGC